MKRFTHKGWFGICPIHIAFSVIDGHEIKPSLLLLAPLLWITEAVFTLDIFVRLMINPDAYIDIEKWLRITGKLDD